MDDVRGEGDELRHLVGMQRNEALREHFQLIRSHLEDHEGLAGFLDFALPAINLKKAIGQNERNLPNL